MNPGSAGGGGGPSPRVAQGPSLLRRLRRLRFVCALGWEEHLVAWWVALCCLVTALFLKPNIFTVLKADACSRLGKYKWGKGELAAFVLLPEKSPRFTVVLCCGCVCYLSVLFCLV